MLTNLYPDAQIVVTGLGGPNSNFHGPDESMDIEYAKKLTGCVAALVSSHASQPFFAMAPVGVAVQVRVLYHIATPQSLWYCLAMPTRSRHYRWACLSTSVRVILECHCTSHLIYIIMCCVEMHTVNCTTIMQMPPQS
jgi:hypothetical protein